MEGPRAVREEEFATLRPLTDTVFRPGMIDQYPQLFNTDNRENLRVCVDNGRCISHVGMTQRQASLFGCPIRVCCVGAVSTHPDYRKQGLASACFDDAVHHAFANGVDLMIVSGDRSLYRQRGCLRVGSDTAFTATSEMQAGPLAAKITVAPMTEEELPLVTECYRNEPVRYLRPLDDYIHARISDAVQSRIGDFLVIRENGQFRAYVIVRPPGEDKRTSLTEFAGDRRILLAAMPEIMRRDALAGLTWIVQRHDRLFRSLCEEAGLSGKSGMTYGTFKLINFPQLMERMRPRWEEILGYREAAKLGFWQRDETYGFRFGADELTTDRDTATRLLFGTPGGAETQVAAGRGALTEILKSILPLPTLWYGINYV